MARRTAALVDTGTGEVLGEVTHGGGRSQPKSDSQLIKELRTQELAIDAAYHRWQGAKTEAGQLKEEYENALLKLRELVRGSKEPPLPFDRSDNED